MSNVRLSVIIAGRYAPDKPCFIVTPIRGYSLITGDAKKGYLCENPVIYCELDGRCFSASLADIVTADYSKSRGNIGSAYRIPREYVKQVERG